MPTSNVVGTFSGTGFTINVAPCNLDPLLTLKDFAVLRSGSVLNNADFDKTTATVLTYTGIALASGSLEVRRITPVARAANPAQFGTRVRSEEWNSELDRIVRRAEEYALNGVGAGSLVQNVNPVNDSYSSAWGADTIFPPTRQAVFNKVETLASLSFVNATFATPAQVAAAVFGLAPLNTPVFTGTPSAPTPAANDNSTRLATTAHVASRGFLDLNSYATAHTNSHRPFVNARRVTATGNFVKGTTQPLVFDTEVTDTDNAWDGTFFTVPAGKGGVYTGVCTATVANVTSAHLRLRVNSVNRERLPGVHDGTEVVTTVGGPFQVLLNAGDVVEFQIFCNNGSANTCFLVTDSGFAGGFTYMQIARLS